MNTNEPFGMDRLRQTIILTLIFTLVLSLPTLLFKEVPDANKTFVNILIGWFIAKGSDAIAFMLNSTDRSQAKDQAIANLAAATPALIAATPGDPAVAPVAAAAAAPAEGA